MMNFLTKFAVGVGLLLPIGGLAYPSTNQHWKFLSVSLELHLSRLTQYLIFLSHIETRLESTHVQLHNVQ